MTDNPTIPYYEELKAEIAHLLQKFIRDKDPVVAAMAILIISNEANRWYSEIIRELINLEFSPNEARVKFAKILAHRNALCDGLKRNVGLPLATLDYFTHSENRLFNPVIIEDNKKNELFGLIRCDGLTSLLNHRAYEEIIRNEANRALRYKTPFALTVIDIDHFKHYNDTYGHAEGDYVLKKIAETLSQNVRNCDFVFRYGGEEFVIIFTNTTKKKAALVVEKLRKLIKAIPFKRRVTVSAGISGFPEDTNSIADCFSFADNALYQAKEAGRDKICLYYIEDRIAILLYKRYLAPIVRIIKSNRLIFFLSILLVLSSTALFIYLHIEFSGRKGKWTLVFADNFQRRRIGPDWSIFKTTSSSGFEEISQDAKDAPWRIINHELCAKSLNFASFIRYTKNISGNLRLEFDARLVYPGRNNINAFICGTSKENGYAFLIGGWENTKTAITRSGAITSLTERIVLNPNQTYHILIERINDRVNLYVNNKKILKFTDYFPLEGENHYNMGLAAQQTHVHFDNFKVYRLSTPLKASPLVAGNTLFENKLYDKAIEQYLEISNAYPQQEIAASALFQVARCFISLNNFPQAKLRLYELLSKYPKHPLARYALLNIGLLAEKEGQIAEAESIILDCKKKFPSRAFQEYITVSFLEILDKLLLENNLLKMKLVERGILFLKDNFPLQAYIYKDSFFAIISNYILLEKYTETLELLQRFAPITDSRNKAAVIDYGQIGLLTGETYAAYGDYPKAIQAWNSITEENPLYYDAIYLKAIALRETGNFQEAIDLLKKLEMSRQFEYTFTPIVTALCLQQNGKFKDAEKEFDNIRFYDENNELSEIGDTLNIVSEFMMGKKEFKDLLAMNNLYNFKLDIWFYIAEYCFLDKKFQDALIGYDKFLNNPLNKKSITYFIAKKRLKEIEKLYSPR